MGKQTAMSLTETELSLEAQLSIHLQYNHYPPVPQSMVPVCIRAIECYWEDDSELRIDLPEGITWRGQDCAPAWAIIEGHHLDAWTVEYDYDAMYDYGMEG